MHHLPFLLDPQLALTFPQHAAGAETVSADLAPSPKQGVAEAARPERWIAIAVYLSGDLRGDGLGDTADRGADSRVEGQLGPFNSFPLQGAFAANTFDACVENVRRFVGCAAAQDVRPTVAVEVIMGGGDSGEVSLFHLVFSDCQTAMDDYRGRTGGERERRTEVVSCPS